MKKIINMIVLLLLLLLLLIVGCGSETSQPERLVYTVDEIDNKIAVINDNFNSINSRLDTLDQNQLTSEDIKNLINTTTINNYEDTSNVTDGCPSSYDVNVKWFDAWQRGDIDHDQYNIIKDKYNSEECQ